MREVHYDTIHETETAHWWYRVRRSFIRRLVQNVQSTCGKQLRILDVGCGTGLVMKELAPFGAVSGIDISQRAVAYCRERGLSPIVASIEKLPFADNSFDVIVMLDVLEHIADDVQAAFEVARVLAPGGTLIMTVPAFQFLWSITDEVSHHYRRYTRSMLIQRLTKAGLHVKRTTYFNTLLFPLIASVRLFVRLFHIRMKSENTLGGAAANTIFYRIFAVEPYLLPYMNFPFGVSILALATKS